MRKLSATRKIICPMCEKQIEAGDLIAHSEKEIKSYTIRQSYIRLQELSKDNNTNHHNYPGFVME